MVRKYCTCTARNGWTLDLDSELWVCSSCRNPSEMAYLAIVEFRSDKEQTHVAANDINTTFIAAFQKFLNDFAEENGIPPFVSNGTSPKAAPVKGRAAKAAPAPEPEEDEDVDSQAERRAELNAMSLPSLRKLLKDAGYDPEEIKSASKATMVDTLLSEEEGSASEDDDEPEDEDVEDEADDEEGEEEETDEGDYYKRSDLEGKGLRELQRIAREEYEYKPADYRGMDVDSLIDMLTGETGEDEEEPEEDEEEGYTEEDLAEMSLADLKGVAGEYGIKLRPGMKPDAIRKAILAEQG